MSIIRVSVLASLVLVFLAGCSSTPSVVTDYDTGYAFGDLNTFRVEATPRQSNPQNLLISPFTYTHLERLIDEKLSERYRPAEEGATPDFVVRYHIVVENRLDMRQFNQRHGFGYYGYGPFYRYPHAMQPTARIYRQGSLIVDVVEGGTNKPLWRGVSEERLQDSLSPEEQRQRLGAAITDIMSNFPPVR